MITNKERTVAEIVANNIKTADVFKKHGIDFCCGGGISIAEVCKKKNISVDELEAELLKVDNKISRSNDYNNWNLDFLVDYIVNNHHSFVLENIPLIVQYSNKVAKVHGENHPETIKINQLFLAVAEELISHMEKEEKILFPYIKNKVKSLRENTNLPQPHFGTAKNPIKMMEEEHENAGDIFKEIAKLSNNFTPPLMACSTYKVLYFKLKEFEEDLHQHIHLENNILFPKIIKMEKESIN